MTYSFDGATNYFEDVSADFASLPLTIFIRNKATVSLSGNPVLLMVGNNVDQNGVMIRASGNSIAQIRQQNGAGTGTNVGVAQTMNSWGTLVGRFNGNASRDIFDSGGKTSGTATVSSPTTMDRLVLGCGIGASGAKTAFCQTMLNIVAVWNVALDDSECLSLTGNLANPLQVRPQSLIRLYNLENLTDYMGRGGLTATGSPSLISADTGRKKYPRRNRQSQY